MYQALLTEKSGMALLIAPVQFGIPLLAGENFNPKKPELVTGDDTVIRWLAPRSDRITIKFSFSP
jgi:hypothetical protein